VSFLRACLKRFLTSIHAQPMFSCFVSNRFPPSLWLHLSKMWNRSSTPFLICYHGPKDIIHSYEFMVELIAQASTSMHGSKEGHTGYLYQRKPKTSASKDACDPLFAEAWKKVQSGLATLKGEVDATLNEKMASGTSTRSSHRSHC
jgi:hypothetical protein